MTEKAALTQEDHETVMACLDKSIIEWRKAGKHWRRKKNQAGADICAERIVRTFETAKRYHAHFRLPGGELKLKPE